MKKPIIDKLKKFKCASFAFWKDDIADVSFINTKFPINNKVVIFGLNPSKNIGDFQNFHKGRYDKWYKEAFSNPPYRYAYMTDVITKSEPRANIIMKRWGNDEKFRKRNKDEITEQLKILRLKKPAAIAIGRQTEEILLSPELRGFFKKIFYLPHPNSIREKDGIKKFVRRVRSFKI